MKTKKYTAVTAETYVEEQFMMARFPEVYWRHREGGSGIIFYIPENRMVDLEIALEDWRKRTLK